MSFEAKYPGKCWNCGEPFPIGTTITYDNAMPEPHVIGSCCEDAEITTEPRADHTAPVSVMPRGRSVSDRCGRCFQIPASNGTCGCS